MTVDKSNINIELPIFHQNCAMIFQGQTIESKNIEQYDFTNQKVAIIGTDQFTVTQLSAICRSSKSVVVFQNNPEYILPKTKQIFQQLLYPLLVKNRQILNQRVRSLIALRFLEKMVSNYWLKHQLIPNSAQLPKNFLHSDDYYTALQENNCQLTIWPIKEIISNGLMSIEGVIHPADMIILAN